MKLIMENWSQFLKGTEKNKILESHQDEEGDGFTDASLDESDFEVLEWILNDLQIDSGHGDVGAKHDRSDVARQFAVVMEKLGIKLRGKTQSEYSPEEEDQIRSSVMGSMANNPPSTPWSSGR